MNQYDIIFLMRLNFLLILLLILIFLALNLPHLLEFTTIWADESWIADVSLNILKTGKPSTEIWGNMIPSASQYVFWYPPVFFYILAFWFKLFGFSIITQRLPSLVISGSYIIIFFTFSRFLISKGRFKLSDMKISLFVFIGSLLLMIDPIFFRSSVMSRPEILILALVTCSGMLVAKAVDSKTSVNSRTLWLVIGGLMVGISILTHFLAGIFLLALVFYIAVSLKNFLLDKSFYFFIISALIPPVIWLLIILPDWNILNTQLSMISQSRKLTPNYLTLSFSVLPVVHKIAFIIYSAVSLTLVAVYLLTRKNYLLLISIFSGASWLVSYYGKTDMKAIYIIPFVYLALVLLLIYSYSNIKSTLLKDLKILVILFASVILILAVNNYINIASYVADQSYLEFLKSVKSTIPKGKTVFLSSIPDVYYAFKSDDSYRLYEFPMAKTEQEEFKRLLTKLDYVVINSPLSNMYVGNTLDDYLQNNTAEVVKVSGGGYSVFVYKLKSQKN